MTRIISEFLDERVPLDCPGCTGAGGVPIEALTHTGADVDTEQRRHHLVGVVIADDKLLVGEPCAVCARQLAHALEIEEYASVRGTQNHRRVLLSRGRV